MISAVMAAIIVAPLAVQVLVHVTFDWGLEVL